MVLRVHLQQTTLLQTITGTTVPTTVQLQYRYYLPFTNQQYSTK